MLTRDADGVVEATELADVGDPGNPPGRAARVPGRGRRWTPRSSHEAWRHGGALIWETLWAAPAASDPRHSGAQLIADGRNPDPGDHRVDRSRRCNRRSRRP